MYVFPYKISSILLFILTEFQLSFSATHIGEILKTGCKYFSVSTAQQRAPYNVSLVTDTLQVDTYSAINTK